MSSWLGLGRSRTRSFGRALVRDIANLRTRLRAYSLPLLDRVTLEDLMSLAADHGTVPMHAGAVLTFARGPRVDPVEFAELLADRVTRVPRLRRKLVHLPLGGGRPMSVDDPEFSVDRHLTVLRRTDPGSQALDVAAEMIVRRLPADRPRWAATLVLGDDGDGALVLVYHHVMADGMAGLEVLARLADEAEAPA